jgi:hypothetical protein
MTIPTIPSSRPRPSPEVALGDALISTLAAGRSPSLLGMPLMPCVCFSNARGACWGLFWGVVGRSPSHIGIPTGPLQLWDSCVKG